MKELDLIVVAADKDISEAMKSLLRHRAKALKIRKIDFHIIKHSRHDPGIRKDAAVELLRPYLNLAKYALVIFDYEGSGERSKSPRELERHLEKLLERNGWKGRASVIAIDPEFEIWLWKGPHSLAKALGIEPHRLSNWLEGQGVSLSKKPDRPKELFDKILEELLNEPHSSGKIGKLATEIDLKGCKDRSFRKLRQKLREWFGEEKVDNVP